MNYTARLQEEQVGGFTFGYAIDCTFGTQAMREFVAKLTDRSVEQIDRDIVGGQTSWRVGQLALTIYAAPSDPADS
jgi:hypothetical protein